MKMINILNTSTILNLFSMLISLKKIFIGENLIFRASLSTMTLPTEGEGSYPNRNRSKRNFFLFFFNHLTYTSGHIISV